MTHPLNPINMSFVAVQAALSAEFKLAVPTYEEKPRTKWIFENSVQNTVVVSRTFFTQEVNEAFADMEDGNEVALRVRLNKSQHLFFEKLRSMCFISPTSVCHVDFYKKKISVLSLYWRKCVDSIFFSAAYFMQSLGLHNARPEKFV